MHYRYVSASDPATVRRPDPAPVAVRRPDPGEYPLRIFAADPTPTRRVPFNSRAHVGRRMWTTSR